MNSEYLKQYQALESEQIMVIDKTEDYMISLQKGTTSFSNNKMLLEHKTLGYKHEITGSDIFWGITMRLNTYFANLNEREVRKMI
ncbi:MAG: hypothetical protein ACK5HR_07220 [Mycoplasmatales bacterium]